MDTKFNNLDEIFGFHNINRKDFEKSTLNLSKDTQAYEILKLIISAYNNNEKPDFSNANQVKYEPWFYFDSSSGGFAYYDFGFWVTVSDVGSRLCYLDLNNLKEATKNEEFLKIYNQYLN